MASGRIWEKDEEYYYLIFDSDLLGLAKLRVVRVHTGLFPSFEIEKNYTPKLGKQSDRIKEGNVVSANELPGVGASGPDEYIFKKQDTFKRIFYIGS